MVNDIHLTREEFKRLVFERDCVCVCCGEPPVDAHHIIERKLWGESGGYYVDNGASVCADCHWKCEDTSITPQFLRDKCEIDQIILPDCLDPTNIYDKWGNIVLDDTQRVAGPLFDDEQVQKILDKHIRTGRLVFHMTALQKYPRTFHVPWSLGKTSDDKTLSSMEQFHGHDVVITEKMDGENTTMYRDYIHARSVDSRHHQSRDWVKAFHATIKDDIPEGWRICGENVYAQHSIAYEDLCSYFMGFSIWNEHNVCLSFTETIEWFSLLGISCVPILGMGKYEEVKSQLMNGTYLSDKSEGYVIRKAGEFHIDEFPNSVGKFVRENHVQTDTHWMHDKITPNKLFENVVDSKVV